MKMQKTDVDLGAGNVPRLLFRLALPAIAAQIINVLYNIVDRIFIGHLPEIGAAALTGVGVTFPVILAVSAFAMLVSMGGAPRASIMLGRGNREEAEKILGGCAASLVVTSLLLTAVLLIWGEEILYLFGASDNTIGYAVSYMNIYAVGTLFVQLAMGLNAFINAQGYAVVGMITVAVGAVCNIILDAFFMLVLDMGVEGAALATVISQFISAMWVVSFLVSKRSGLRIKTKNLLPRPKIMLPCLALGLAPFVMQFTESILFVCFNTSLLKYGRDTAVGAMTILSSVMQFSMLPLLGLTQGSQPIVSFNYGAEKPERVKKAVKVLLISCVSYSALLWAVSMAFPGTLAGFFTDDGMLLEYSTRAMRIYMAASLIFGLQIACQQTFIALGNAKTSLFLALLRKVFLLIPLIFILPHIVAEADIGVFLAEPVADTVAVTVTVLLFGRFFGKLMKEGKQSLPR